MMKILLSFILFIVLFAIIYFYVYPTFIFYQNKDLLKSYFLECEQAKISLKEFDKITQRESMETKSNFFLNLKLNESFCFDYELLKNKLISNGFNENRLKTYEMEIIRSNFKMIENRE